MAAFMWLAHILARLVVKRWLLTALTHWIHMRHAVMSSSAGRTSRCHAGSHASHRKRNRAQTRSTVSLYVLCCEPHALNECTWYPVTAVQRRALFTLAHLKCTEGSGERLSRKWEYEGWPETRSIKWIGTEEFFNCAAWGMPRTQSYNSWKLV